MYAIQITHNERNLDMKKESTLKGIFVVIGALVSIAALVVVVYTVFKKYFKVTFECDGCDCCDDECFADEDACYEPICCCEDEETVEEAADEAEDAE